MEKCFGLGTHTVVLAFNDYDHVPSSKVITQAKCEAEGELRLCAELLPAFQDAGGLGQLALWPTSEIRDQSSVN